VRSNRELWLAFLTMILIALLYLGVMVRWQQVPAASEFVGHGLGILGFILMLCTETLYSLRKRTRSARWGRMASWLEFHIYTGLVGPFLVLLHTSWKFNGLAGIVTLMMVIVVLSGFFGRYIYTAVPRTADGIEVAASTLAQEINRAQQQIESVLEDQPAELQALIKQSTTNERQGAVFIFGRVFYNTMDRLYWWSMFRRIPPQFRQQAIQLQRLARQSANLRSQLASLALARRMLGVWHAVHIPIGMALFTAAFVHILGAIYYATLLH
jgi:hypothetical protein